MTDDEWQRAFEALVKQQLESIAANLNAAFPGLPPADRGPLMVAVMCGGLVAVAAANGLTRADLAELVQEASASAGLSQP